MSWNIKSKGDQLKSGKGCIDGFYLKSYVVLNGLYRRDALLRICNEPFHQLSSEKRNKAALEFGLVRVNVWGRKDGKLLPGYETTAVGSMANEGTSRMRRPTFPDQLHLCMYFL